MKEVKEALQKIIYKAQNKSLRNTAKQEPGSLARAVIKFSRPRKIRYFGLYTYITHISQQLQDNTAVSLCDCDKEKYKTLSDDTDNEKIKKKIAVKSKCQAMVDGMPLFGTREDICEKGKMPETRRQREEQIRQVEQICLISIISPTTLVKTFL